MATTFTKLGVDIGLQAAHWEARMLFSVATKKRLDKKSGTMVTDFAVVKGADNLAQAILIRLLTPMGELSALGHPDYGSHLYSLIGERNNETMRNRAKLYILESLQKENRIKKIVDVEVSVSVATQSGIDITIRVQPADNSDILTIPTFSLEFTP
jgi:phage gp46-like protein